MTTVTLTWVDNTPLREEALRQVECGVSWSEIARAAGMHNMTQLKRRLGLAPEGGRLSTRVRYKTAVRLADALGLDYIDVGV